MKSPLLVLLMLMLSAAPVWGGGKKEAEIANPKALDQAVQQEFDRHDYQRVIGLYKEFSSAHPEAHLSFGVRVLYSHALASTGNLEGAIEALQAILAELPSQVDSLRLNMDLANLLFMEKRYAEAKKAYQKILIQSSEQGDIVKKARERLNGMKENEGKKKDVMTLQLLEIESSLERGESPEGAGELLQKIQDENPATPLAENAARLLTKLREVRTEKARSMLEEARRLFDQEKKFAAVREILDRINTDFSDVCEKQSVEALLNAVNLKEGKGPAR